MKNVALRIEYDGTDFVGSQWQKNGRSVQGEIEGAWEQLTQERQRVTLSGRTDSGVHALGQVANVRTGTRLEPETIQRGLNAILPEDVAVHAAWYVPMDFHARHSAIRRDYRYLIDHSPVESPLARRHVVHVPKRLDTTAMQAGLAHFEGTHDFAAFTVAAFEGTTVRTCFLARCSHVEWLGRELIAIDIAANAFLQHMVRNIVGTVIQIGEGRMDPAAISTILAGRDRRKAGRTAPAHGLYLTAVSYPPTVPQPALDGARSDVRI